MTNNAYYKILHDVPQIPEDLLHSKDFEDALTRSKSLQVPSGGGYVRPDGSSIAPEILSREIPKNLEQWINQNVCSLTNNSVIYRKLAVNDKSNFYPPHIDTKRTHTLLYNIVDSGGELVFWKEKNKPIFRGAPVGPHVVTDYTQLEELCRIKSPYKTWYIINSRVIHSVENLSGVRESIQISCQVTDKIVADSLIMGV